MIAGLLKAVARVSAAASVLSALAGLYGGYQLSFGPCHAGCDAGLVYDALFHTGVIGLVGFGVSALAAHRIGLAFEGDRHKHRD
jgi:hypothetical protein